MFIPRNFGGHSVYIVEPVLCIILIAVIDRQHVMISAGRFAVRIFNTHSPDKNMIFKRDIVAVRGYILPRFLCFLALDVVLYDVRFEGMKLSGIILIGVGFFLVMFPDNWPDYIMRLLR